MGEKYANLVGRVHLVKESIRQKWTSAKEEGGITHTIGTKVDQVKEGVIEKINHGDLTYDHLYRLLTKDRENSSSVGRHTHWNCPNLNFGAKSCQSR